MLTSVHQYISTSLHHCLTPSGALAALAELHWLRWLNCTDSGARRGAKAPRLAPSALPAAPTQSARVVLQSALVVKG